ncbi:hypothetical protein [Dactylosporangium sp. NPDC051541]|uniref:hypothetical protein n=1 Tax=Dactylosporangium sp. NPDC051541 TaxID=3363977 RepID=UPI0037B79E2F
MSPASSAGRCSWMLWRASSSSMRAFGTRAANSATTSGTWGRSVKASTAADTAGRRFAAHPRQEAGAADVPGGLGDLPVLPGDDATRAAAIAHGRAVGVPEHQLDWKD